MLKSRARRRAATAATLLAGAGLLGIIGPAGPAVAAGGPAAAGSALAFSVKLDIGQLHRACTGALINRWWLVTAKSCFAGGSGDAVTAGAPTVATRATIGRLNLTTTGGLVRDVTKVVPHPDRDLVLARLSDEVPAAATVPVATTAPAVGDKIVAAGFGRTAGEWLPDELHAGEFAVTAVTDGTLDVTATADGAICRGDAGGPALRPAASGYELVGVHSRSWHGGCFGETSTRRAAVEARVDDIAPWIAANSKYPNALRLSTTDTRIGVLKGDYGTQVKEGGLGTAWTDLVANAKDIVVIGTRVGVLTHDGVAYVKDGATTAAFVKVHTGVKHLALSAKRVGVITDEGVAFVKEGALNTAWVNQGSNVASLAVTDTRVGIVSADVFGNYKVKEGGLSAAWTGPTGTGRPMVSRIVLSGSRVGLLYRSGAAEVYEGNMKWGADIANKTKWHTLMNSGASALTINDDRVGVLTTAGVALVKEGAMTTAFVTEYTGVRHLAVSGSRVGVVTGDGAALVKHGALNAAWTTVW